MAIIRCLKDRILGRQDLHFSYVHNAYALAKRVLIQIMLSILIW